MKTILVIAAGGAFGAVARYGVGVFATRMFGMSFPWGTLIVNIGGSFLLGALIEVMALRWSVSPEMRAFLVIGVMGAFTTFSTFSMDVVVLFQRGMIGLSALYIATSVVGALLGFMAGLRVLRLILV